MVEDREGQKTYNYYVGDKLDRRVDRNGNETKYVRDQLGRTIEKINPELKIKGVLRTMFDVRNSLAGEVSGQLKRHFGNKLFYSLVHIKVPKQTSLIVILGEINTIFYCTKYSCKAPHLILLSILHSFLCNVFLFQRTKTKYHHVVHS